MNADPRYGKPEVGKSPLVFEATEYFEYFLLPHIRIAKNFFNLDKLQFNVMAHGAGTQTTILQLLANYPLGLKPGDPGYIRLDFAMHADVGDLGQSCEWPETDDYLRKATYHSVVPLFRVEPSLWVTRLIKDNDNSGLYNRYLKKQIIPIRMLRSCTGDFKVKPQLAFLAWLYNRLTELGIELRIRHTMGFSKGEEHRAARFNPGQPYIHGHFPLIEWGWTRQDTLNNFKKLRPQTHSLIGSPNKSGCWFCPFQKRGKIDPVTLKPTPRSWLALSLEHPDLFNKALEMEISQNKRRTSIGKKPIYLYGNKPLPYWVNPEKRTVTKAMFNIHEYEANEGDKTGDDICDSWGCFR